MLIRAADRVCCNAVSVGMWVCEKDREEEGIVCVYVVYESMYARLMCWSVKAVLIRLHTKVPVTLWGLRAIRFFRFIWGRVISWYTAGIMCSHVMFLGWEMVTRPFDFIVWALNQFDRMVLDGEEQSASPNYSRLQPVTSALQWASPDSLNKS